VTDTFESDSDESLAPAAEALVCRVVESTDADLEDLIRQFPHAADFLRLTAAVLPRESTAGIPRTADGAMQSANIGPPQSNEETSSHPTPTGMLERGRALEICRKFELDLKHGHAPSIESCVRAVAEPQRSALLSMLLAAELQFRVRLGERPGLQGYRLRFPEHLEIVEAVHAGSVGPERIGAFGVLRFLGGGSFGTVYLCRDEQLDRLVAIKVPRPDRFTGPEDVDRFLREARLAARIKHPGIVTVFQVDRDPAIGCFVVLEYIEGRSLSAQLNKERLALEHSAAMMIAIAEALSFAHEQGLVHRDLKPANILLDLQERPHIADFGLAVHETERWPIRGEVAGTPPYMAPEQVRGESHRLDGRTDIWGLGVILYRMLTGHRPFDGKTTEEVFDDILNREPVPLRQRDRTVPNELERICLKCLSKRMTDRYTTASDLADDLRQWLVSAAKDPQMNVTGRREPNRTTAPGERFVHDSGAATGIQVRPKGLRAFDVDDRDFFLGLLPGPRDRDGLPESLRFWKTRIEPGAHDNPFSVGLLCGPSGCGKTSMIKAGLLCVLSPDVISVYVEASAEATETRLRDALDRIGGAPGQGLSLPETVAAMRSRAILPEGRKVLIVLDQFEQWLHADNTEGEGEGELVRALRQCDGATVQCLVLVRDDFAMAAARFMRALEIRLVESQNFATVDQFDRVHTHKILYAFGVAYDRFGSGDRGNLNRFLDQAVDELAADGKVAPVQLALFAQLIKDKPWTPATLREVGGLEGIGVTFLEQSLASPSANPEHRLHLPAARAVLKALLPQGGADIKGHMRSHDELLELSGYASRPRDFDTLLTILGTELRLITPTDPRGVELEDDPKPGLRAGRYYHLTHDYLVPPLRQWLTHKQRETRQGRVEVLLANLTAYWIDHPERRRLPSVIEWLAILWYTRSRAWTPADRRMMNAATRHYLSGAGTAVALVAGAIIIGIAIRQRERSATLLERTLKADFGHFPGLLAELDTRRDSLRKALEDIEATAAAPARDREVAELLLYRDRPTDTRAAALRARLVRAGMDELTVIRDTLAMHPDQAGVDQIRATLLDESAEPGVRLRAACVLTALGPVTEATWESSATALTQAILAEDRRAVAGWILLLGAASRKLIPELNRVTRDSTSDSTRRSTAAEALAETLVLSHDPVTLASSVVESQPDASRVLQDQLIQLPERDVSRSVFQGILNEKGSGPAKDALAKRQASACIAMAALGDVDVVWPLLRHNDDPCLRSYVIQKLATADFLRQALIDRLAHPGLEAVEKQAIVLVWAETNLAAVSSAHRARVVEIARALYRDDPDSGVHSAVELLLRRFGQTEIVTRYDQELGQRITPADSQGWVIGPNGHTFAILRGPLEFRLGSPPDEEAREPTEKPHHRRIDRTLAVATKEVTLEQFRKFQSTRVQEDRHTTSPSCPVHSVTWYDAAAYCNWLSEHDLELKRCYADNVKSGMALFPDALEHPGYRLPTEAEWEYFCRGKTGTSRPFGETDELMPKFAWTWLNSRDQLHPVGLLLPNELGLFDVLGNAYEWCHDGQRAPGKTPFPPYPDGSVTHPAGDPDEARPTLDNSTWRIMRGGAFCYAPAASRSAARYSTYVTLNHPYVGFRVVRTLPPQAK
jgi:eukaryotic-like serine/threonine-protein kinase